MTIMMMMMMMMIMTFVLFCVFVFVCFCFCFTVIITSKLCQDILQYQFYPHQHTVKHIFNIFFKCCYTYYYLA